MATNPLLKNSSSNGFKLYIRKCYTTIWDQSSKLQRTIVLSGTKGIGKTYFLFYAIWRMLQSQQSFTLYFPCSNHLNRNIFSCWYDSGTKLYDVCISDRSCWPDLIIVDSSKYDEVDGTSLSSFTVGFFCFD